MASHNEFGKKAEQLAEQYFKDKNYEIVCKNWRHKSYEIDIIATLEGILHFIEVKARRSNEFGFPEDSVTTAKFKCLVTAADEFLFQNPEYSEIQYDVLSITIHAHRPIEYFLIEDVFIR